MSLNFLIWLIIAIIFFGGFIGCTAKYLYLSFKPNPHSELIGFIEQVAAKDKVMFDYKIIRIPKDEGLIGFSENTKKLEYSKEGNSKYSIEIPESCNNKNCLCLCEDFIFEIINQDAGNEYYFVDCKAVSRCHKFDNIKFTPSVYLNKDKTKIWKGGFLLSGSTGGDKTKATGPSKTIYIKKFGNTLSVCDTAECSEFKEVKSST